MRLNIAHLVEEYLKRFALLPRDADTALSKAVQATFNDLEGLNAVIVINTKAQELVAARNGSPLVVGFGHGENYLASDPAALLPYTKQVHFLEDDEIAIIGKENIHMYNTKTGEPVPPRKQLLKWTTAEAEKGKNTNDNKMLKKITNFFIDKRIYINNVSQYPIFTYNL